MGSSVRARQALIREPGDLIIQETEMGPPGPGEVLIASEVSLPSPGTELAVYEGYHQWLSDPDHPWSFPFQPGYANVGRIIAVGPDVQHLQVGQRVLSSGPHATHIIRRVGEGRPIDPYVVPEGLAPERAVFANLAQYGLAAVLMSTATMGRSVVVQGLGAIGQLALRLFAAAGAFPLLGVDPVPRRRELALAGGAEGALDLDDVKAKVRSWTDGGADIVADATGLPQGVISAMELAANGGRIVVVGSPRGRVNEVNFYPLHNRCLSLVGAHGSFWSKTRDRNLPLGRRQAVEMLLMWLKTGRLTVDELISQTVALDELGDLYHSLHHDRDHQLAPIIRY